MSLQCQPAAGPATKAVAESRDEIRAVEFIAESRKWFVGLAKSLSKEKPAPAVAYLTGENPRTCYDWCAGKFDPPARVVLKLLQSDAGWIVLQHLMRGCKQPWWHKLQRAQRCAAAYEAEREQYEMDV